MKTTFSPPPEPFRSLSISQLWRRLVDFFTSRLPDVIETINTPATKLQISNLENDLNIRLPEELLELFECANGQKSGCPIIPAEYSKIHGKTIATWGEFGDLSIVNQITKMHIDLRDSNPWSNCTVFGPVVVSLESTWIVFVSPGSGDSIALDMTPAKNGNVGQVIAINHDPTEIHVLAPSLQLWLASLVYRYEIGRYVMDEDEFTPQDHLCYD